MYFDEFTYPIKGQFKIRYIVKVLYKFFNWMFNVCDNKIIIFDIYDGIIVIIKQSKLVDRQSFSNRKKKSNG